MNRKLIRPFSTAFDLFKTHLPQSVSKDIYNKEIEDYKSYNYTEKDITNLNLFLETLTHQSELLQRYQYFFNKKSIYLILSFIFFLNKKNWSTKR